jgi:AmmeMemoRadiSam system protein B/AmmeMemoRadiSam system protein A
MLFTLYLILFLFYPGCNAKSGTLEEEIQTQTKVDVMKPNEREVKVRSPAKAGTWYEGEPKALKKQIMGFLNTVDVPEIHGTIRALISPHAGYLYSGKTAAHGFKTLLGSEYKRVIVLAPSHYARFEGGSILDVTHYETPLGTLPLDREACDELLHEEFFTTVPSAHGQEHSLELQLPFLQCALKDGFKLIPIVIGEIRSSWYEPMAECLLSFWDEETLIVTSSDFTHYGANFGYLPFKKDIPENLKKLDLGAVQKILDVNYKGFESYVRKTGATICGRKPITLLLTMAALRNAKGHLLTYTTSGALTGDFSHSVSYASIGFTIPETSGGKSSEQEFGSLSKEEEETLIRLARHTLKIFLAKGKKPKDLSGFAITENLKRDLGVFVTLKKKDRLRGCIGYLKGIMPLYQAVIDNTISAASRDPRFPPVTPSEEAKLHIEISVLSPLRRVTDVEDIVVGRDGLIISRGLQKGTLLPQVPVEQGWDRIQFLEQACRKAGLPENAYEDSDTIIERYTAQVFGEPK